MKYAQRILLSTQTVVTTTGGLFAPIYAIYVEKLGGSILETSASYAVFGIVYGVLMLVIGRFTDKVKEQEFFLIAGFFLSGIGYLGYLFAHSVAHLFLLQAVLGVSLAVMTPAHDALYTKHLDSGRQASEWGTWKAVYWIATGVSSFIGGMIVVFVSFDALFVVMGSASLLAGVYIWLLPRRVL